jgi:hypothetical protein
MLPAMTKLRILLTAIVATMALPAVAAAKDGDVRRSGTCSGASSVKLKLSPENGRIETELEVDQNRNGVRWRVVLRRNGARAARTSAVTRGPSGSFEVRRLLADGAGADTVTARATSPSGEVCRVRATLG